MPLGKVRIPDQSALIGPKQRIRVPALLSDSESQYSEVDHASPCVQRHPSRKRKRPVNGTRRGHQEGTRDELPTTKTRGSQHHGIRVEPAKSQKSSTFVFATCICRKNHQIYSLVIPAAWTKSYEVFSDKVRQEMGCDLSQGVVTDLTGNELWKLSQNWNEYMVAGINSLCYHEDYFANVKLGDRPAAQARIKIDWNTRQLEPVGQLGTSSSPMAMPQSSDVIGPNLSDLRHEALTRSLALPSTPPPRNVRTNRSNESSPGSSSPKLSWTAKTSGSGRITSLRQQRVHEIHTLGVLGVSNSAASEKATLILVSEDEDASRSFFDQSHQSGKDK